MEEKQNLLPTRDLILKIAHQLFNEKGYHATSMRSIAEAAGIAVGGIYNHFANKEEIFAAMLATYHPFLVVFPAMNAAQGNTLEALIRDAAQRMVASMGENTDFLNLLLIELVEFDGKHIPEMFGRLFPMALEFGQKLNSFKPGIRPLPTPVLIRAFLGLFISYVITGLLGGEQMNAMMPADTLDRFVDIFLYGILERTA